MDVAVTAAAASREAAATRARLALVRPPAFQILKSLSYYGAVPPIGLAYVAAALRDAGHHLQVIDGAGEALDRFTPLGTSIGVLHLNGLTPAEIVARLEPGTEILGITHMFLHEWPTVREIAERARARFPGLFVMVGGENATAFWGEILQETEAVDCCVLGEGEATVLEVVARVKRGEPLEGLPGVATRGGASGLPARVRNLSEIAPPAWELFPMDAYMAAADNFGVHRGRSIPMLATRGCPFQCTFCSSPQMWTTRYVTRPPREVVDEIKRYVAAYGVENVDFCDLTAIVKKDWILEFCRLLRE
ncbi:MAG: B12-binding domain-containing radical SAM protein [Armatimonadetes bacterium]|nr:B12-binding domain-containing radical SAM protein [Armatimonadota bacterium]